jgi:8-oxo-dGTP pyrophosphatase MutT (NUDIX family)
MNVQFAQKAVIEWQGKILLIKKSKDDPHQPGKWELPGGRLKQNESLDDALIREVREEVGLEVAPGRPLALWSWRLGEKPESPTVVAVARLCVAMGAEVSLEHHDEDDYIERCDWFDPNDVLDLDLIPSARQPISAAIQNLVSRV